MTRISLVCVVFLSMIGFTNLFAAQHGGGHGGGGRPSMGAPRGGAPRGPSMGRSGGGPKFSAGHGTTGFRPSGGGHSSSTFRPSMSGGHSSGPRVGSTGGHVGSTSRPSMVIGSHSGSARAGSVGGHAMARSGGTSGGHAASNLNLSSLSPNQRTNLNSWMATSGTAADRKSLQNYFGTTKPPQQHYYQKHTSQPQHSYRQPIQYYQPRSYSYHGGHSCGGGVGINIAPVFSGRYCQTGCGGYDCGYAEDRCGIREYCDECHADVCPVCGRPIRPLPPPTHVHYYEP